MTTHLILGGARSGKSRYAEEQAKKISLANHQSLLYVATAVVRDDHGDNSKGNNEMKSRVVLHQQRRDSSWHLIEEPLHLGKILDDATDKQCILIDCLTLWLTNALMKGCWSEVKSALFASLNNTSASVFFVSNEVGSGIVPMGELTRQFVDEAGCLHQELAELCEQVSLVVAGLPLSLKNTIELSSK
jgi:adenosylcobinamide kinase / adenosylcobinamide-phosphate guanylyltransferase